MVLTKGQLWSTLGLCISLVLAQSSSKCNPRNTTCSPDAAFGTDYTFDFSQAPSAKLWQQTIPGTTFDSENGATFAIRKQGDAPTIRTDFTFFFGRTEVHLKVAQGQGIVSSIMWLSDDLDEVDFEFFGSFPRAAYTNIFGKGILDYYYGKQHFVSADLHDDYHNFTTEWTADHLEWYLDGVLLRTLLPHQADQGSQYPQTPMRLSIGIWAGGDPSLPSGTIRWAGGITDFSKGPYNMYVRNVQVTDYSTGKEYMWGDRSGNWQSIKPVAGISDALHAIQHGFLTKADDLRLDPPPSVTTSSSSPTPTSSRVATSTSNRSDIEISPTSINDIPRINTTTIIPTPNVLSDQTNTNSNTNSSLSDNWNSLSTVAKVAVYSGAGCLAGILVLSAGFYCVKQRRIGARQAEIADAQYAAERAEDERLRNEGCKLDSIRALSTKYDAQQMRQYRGFSSGPSAPVDPSWNMVAQHTFDPIRPRSSGGGRRSPVPLLSNRSSIPRMQSPTHAGTYTSYSASKVISSGPSPGYGGQHDIRPASPYLSPTRSDIHARSATQSPAQTMQSEVSYAAPYRSMTSSPVPNFSSPNTQRYSGYRTLSPSPLSPRSPSNTGFRSYRPSLYAPPGHGGVADAHGNGNGNTGPYREN